MVQFPGLCLMCYIRTNPQWYNEFEIYRMALLFDKRMGHTEWSMRSISLE